MIFMTTLFTSAVTYNSVIPFAAQERASFYRERASQTYNALWYFFGTTIAEIPYVFVNCFALMVPYFPMAGFTGAPTFFFYWLVLSTTVLTFAYVGQVLAFALPTIEIAMITSVLLVSILSQFMGFNPPPTALPSGWKWIYQINPPRFSFAVLSAIVFGDCPADGPDAIGCRNMDNLPPTVPSGLNVKEYVEVVFDAKHDDIGLNVLYVFIAIIFFRILALLSLRFINHQKR